MKDSQSPKFEGKSPLFVKLSFRESCDSKLSAASYKIFEANCSFRLKQRIAGKFHFQFIKRFLLGLTKFSFWQGDCTLRYHSMGIRHFLDIS